MSFPSDTKFADKLTAAIKIASEIKKVLLLERKLLGSASYDADNLLDLLAIMKRQRDALVTLKGQLRFNGGAEGTLANDFNDLIQAIQDFLRWANDNLPKAGGWLSLFKLDTDFNVIPRSFTEVQKRAVDSKIQNILTEID